MGRPFRITSTPATNVNEGVRVEDDSFATVMKHAQRESETVADAAREGAGPDREVGSKTPVEGGQNRGEDHPQSPIYRDAIPWPPAQTGHMPMKNLK